MVKLQKHKSYRYKRKTHFKHVVIIPEKIVQQLGWNEGQELTFSISNSGLVVKPSTTIDFEEEQ